MRELKVYVRRDLRPSEVIDCPKGFYWGFGDSERNGFYMDVSDAGKDIPYIQIGNNYGKVWYNGKLPQTKAEFLEIFSEVISKALDD